MHPASSHRRLTQLFLWQYCGEPDRLSVPLTLVLLFLTSDATLPLLYVQFETVWRPALRLHRAAVQSEQQLLLAAGVAQDEYEPGQEPELEWTEDEPGSTREWEREVELGEVQEPLIAAGSVSSGSGSRVRSVRSPPTSQQPLAPPHNLPPPSDSRRSDTLLPPSTSSLLPVLPCCSRSRERRNSNPSALSGRMACWRLLVAERLDSLLALHTRTVYLLWWGFAIGLYAVRRNVPSFAVDPSFGAVGMSGWNRYPTVAVTLMALGRYGVLLLAIVRATSATSFKIFCHTLTFCLVLRCT
jgi:hypothetical protein